MASAIELYQRAYDTDYRQGDWEYAEELYNAILEQYPHSDEADYARVHLDRIGKLKSNPDEQELRPSRAGSGPSALAIVCFVLVLPLMMAVGGLGYLTWQQYQSTRYHEAILLGKLQESAGNLSAAKRKYESAQNLLPGNPLAFRFLGELYLDAGLLEKAAVQKKHWEIIAPYDPDIKDFGVRMEKRARPDTGTHGTQDR